MRRYPVLFLLLLAVLLNACSGSLPFSLDFSPTSTKPAEAPTATFALLPTKTATATLTPAPTRRSPFPVTLRTPLPDPGFLKIGSGNVTLLKTVFSHTAILRQVSLISPNQQRIMIASTGGLFLLDREGNTLVNWPELRLFDVACQYCISINFDASRFAMLTRLQGAWEVQVYDVIDGQANLFKAIPVPDLFRYEPDPVQLALSTDGSLLAYGFGKESFAVYDLAVDQKIFEFKGQTKALRFSSDGSSLLAQRGNELLLWNVRDLSAGFKNLLLPNERVPLAFSPGGELFVVALPAKIRVYNVASARLLREISVPPTYVTDRAWQIAFTEDNLLSGYGLQWDKNSNSGTVTRAVWDVASGETLELEETKTDSQNGFDTFWGVKFTETDLVGSLGVSEYRDLRFINTDELIVNSLKAACSFKLATGEIHCQEPGDDFLHTSDGSIFHEVRKPFNTLLINALGENIFQLDPYPISWISRSADFLLLDINGDTTDLYLKNKGRPVQSVPGAFRSASENASLLVFLTKQKNELMYMTMVEKSSQKALFQKRETRLFDPMVMTFDGSTYFMREDIDHNQAILKVIPPGTDEVSDLLRIDLSAKPLSMAVSSQNILAVGMQDGSVTVVSLDSLTQQTFQALQSPIDKIAISADGRYLAVAGKNGIKVFAVIP